MNCNQFLTVLFLAVVLLPAYFLGGAEIKLTEEEKEHLFKRQEIECDKPCCHIFFNKYCEICRNSRYE